MEKMPFSALNGARIDKVSTSYLKDVLHDVITAGTFIDPLRLADMKVCENAFKSLRHIKYCFIVINAST